MDGTVELAPDWRTHGWFSFPRQFARDRALSWEARGLAAWMASHDPGFGFDLDYILRCGAGGRDRARRMLRELIDVGYLVRVQDRHENGTMGAICYRLHPERNPRSEPGTVFQGAVAPTQNRRSEPRTDLPGTANAAPAPSYKRDLPPPPSSKARTAKATNAAVMEEEEVEPETTGQVLDDLPAPWRYGVRQRRQLSPLVTAAIAAGWTPEELRKHVSANPGGVKNGFYVTRARLTTDLPPAPRKSKPKSKPNSAPKKSKRAAQPWCGECSSEDERKVASETTYRIRDKVQTRRVWVNCPDCHPERTPV